MKSVLISIQPQHVENICTVVGEENGKPLYKKRVEVRKTASQLETPFKCFIYCTKKYDGSYLYINEPKAREHGITMRWSANAKETQDYGFKGNSYFSYKACGKVIGEFVCDRVDEFHEWQLQPQGKFQEAEQKDLEEFLETSCLSFDEVCAYRKNLPYYKPLYGWHISDLKIYDKPKVLGEFRKTCKFKKTSFICPMLCPYYEYESPESAYCLKPPLCRPPQSWCYVEEI